MSGLASFPTESIESSSNLGTTSNLGTASNITPSDAITPNRKPRSKSPDTKAEPSVVSSSGHHKPHPSNSLRSHSRERFDKEGIWSAIDTLDDVRKMALDNKNKDVFPPGFESNLDISRKTNAQLLHIIKDRADRIAQDIRTSRDMPSAPAETGPSTQGSQRRRKNSKSLGKSLSRKNIARMVDKLESRTNSNNTNSDDSRTNSNTITNSNSFLSVNLGQYNAFNHSREGLRYNSSSSDSDDSDSDSSFSDASSAMDPSATASQRRLPTSAGATNPVYISDYTDYQANITEIAATEVEYVTALIATIRGGNAGTREPHTTETPAKNKYAAAADEREKKARSTHEDDPEDGDLAAETST